MDGKWMWQEGKKVGEAEDWCWDVDEMSVLAISVILALRGHCLLRL